MEFSRIFPREWIPGSFYSKEKLGNRQNSDGFSREFRPSRVFPFPDSPKILFHGILGIFSRPLLPGFPLEFPQRQRNSRFFWNSGRSFPDFPTPGKFFIPKFSPSGGKSPKKPSENRDELLKNPGFIRKFRSRMEFRQKTWNFSPWKPQKSREKRDRIPKNSSWKEREIREGENPGIPAPNEDFFWEFWRFFPSFCGILGIASGPGRVFPLIRSRREFSGSFSRDFGEIPKDSLEIREFREFRALGNPGIPWEC